MSEENLVRLFEIGLATEGVTDSIVAAGQFSPRGSSGAGFAGGMAGGSAGDAVGDLAGGIGVGFGFLAGRRAVEHSSGLPSMFMVGVSDSTVYGMHGKNRRKEPTELIFAVPREHLTATVHQRVNVRVLELVDTRSGVTIELEGSRIPVTHSKDVMDVLTADHERKA
jgi:hypothetical protein